MPDDLPTQFNLLLQQFAAEMVAASQLPNIANNPAALSFLDDVFFCIKLSGMYFLEANRAIQAQAWFAGAAVAAASLEAMLLCKCLTHQNEVCALPKFKTLKKKSQKDYAHFYSFSGFR